MKSSKTLWGVAGIAAMLATLLFIGGFAYAVRTAVFPPPPGSGGLALPSPSSPAGDDLLTAKDIRILAVGDSLTRGIGDSAGKGYVERVREGLAAAMNKETYVWNLAISGSKTADLLEQVEHGDGRMLDYAKQANVILLTIGGNDLFQLGVSSGSNTDSPADPTALKLDFATVTKEMPTAIERLDKILSELSAANPKARIVYVMFYHPFLDYDTERAGSLYVQEWESKAFAIANRLGNVTVVPTYDLFQQVPVKYLYTDHFHPNPDGYARIAERVLQVLR